MTTPQLLLTVPHGQRQPPLPQHLVNQQLPQANASFGRGCPHDATNHGQPQRPEHQYAVGQQVCNVSMRLGASTTSFGPRHDSRAMSGVHSTNIAGTSAPAAAYETKPPPGIDTQAQNESHAAEGLLALRDQHTGQAARQTGIPAAVGHPLGAQNTCAQPSPFSTGTYDLFMNPVDPSSLPSPQGRRSTLSVSQRAALEASFAQNNYPDVEERNRVAAQIQIPALQVDRWFGNRRRKFAHGKHS